MCQSPSFNWVKRGPKWEKIATPCDLCWSCRENYVSDWVGRCLCEAATSQVCCTVSLTYAPPPPGQIYDKVVQPLHFQHFMKRLRNAGHKVRYLVAGEYGDLLGRTHFHAILFFTHIVDQQKPAPYLLDRARFRQHPEDAHPFSREIPQEAMVHIAEWPHGHILVDWSMTEKAVRYCCQYLYKDGKRTAWLSMSKKPPLGFKWFAEKAAKSLDFDVLPDSFEYLPPGGKPGKKYLMTGATRRDFMNLITKDYKDRHKMSPWVRNTFDAIRRKERHDAAAVIPLPPAPPPPAALTEKGRLQLGKDLIDRAERGRQREALEAMLKAGFTDVEEYAAFTAAGGFRSNPYLIGNPNPLTAEGNLQDSPRPAKYHVLPCNCDFHRRKGFADAARGEIRYRDRQGQSLYRSPKVYRPDWPDENPPSGNLPDPCNDEV